MNLFDKICAILACAVAVFMLLVGTVGLFIGCHGGFALPPILGVLPALAGWGILRATYFGWRFKGSPDVDVKGPPPLEQPPVP